MKRIIACMFTLAILIGTAGADAAIIGSTTHEFLSGARTTDTTARLQWGVDPIAFAEPTLFDMNVVTSDVGTSWTISTGALFNATAAVVTNGLNDTVNGTLNRNGAVLSEAFRWFGDDTGASGVDFQGYSIDSFMLTLTKLDIDIPGRNPNNDGLWRDIDLAFNVDVYGNAVGQIPTPATMTLLGIGLVGLVGASARKKSKKKGCG